MTSRKVAIEMTKPHANLPWKSPTPEAVACQAATTLFAQKAAEGFVTGDGQRVMLTHDEVVHLVASYWTDDGKSEVSEWVI